MYPFNFHSTGSSTYHTEIHLLFQILRSHLMDFFESGKKIQCRCSDQASQELWKYTALYHLCTLTAPRRCDYGVEYDVFTVVMQK